MKPDLRGFRYLLEPLLRRDRSRLEALQARLGQATREAADLRAEMTQQKERLAGHVADAAAALGARFDPALHSRTLHWLAREQGAVVATARALEDVRERRAAIAAECLRRQNHLQVIEKDREGCLQRYAREQDNRLAAAADGDWLARRGAGLHAEQVR